MYCLRTKRRRAASSIAHGKLVAARTRTRLASPFSLFFSSRPAAAFCRSDHWIRNSVLIRLVASCSEPPPRAPRSESISSTKIMLGASSLAIENSARTSFSLSPRNLLVKLLAEIAKKILLLSVATARANIVLPVPGGPKSSIPRAGSRRPMNRSGRRKGYTTVSLRALFAISSPATSSQ